MLWEDCAGEDTVDEAVCEALKTLPKDLKEMYQRCLSRVNRDGERKSIVDRVFGWVCVTMEPFRMRQLQEVLVVNLKTGELARSPLQKEVIVFYTNLAYLEKDGPDELVFPAHHSVRQFLFPPTAELALENAEKELESSSDARHPNLQLHRNMVSIIGSRIALVIFRPQPRQIPVSVQLPLSLSRNLNVPKQSGFLYYATNNWALLTRNITTTFHYWTQFKELALLNSDTWDIYPWGPSRRSWDSYVFALYGWCIIKRHHCLLSLAIGQQMRVEKSIFALPLFEKVGQHTLLPVHAVVEAGDVRIIEILLKTPALVDEWPVTDGMGNTLLHRAADNGYGAVVRLLLDRKANVNAKATSGSMLLHLAALGGYNAVVQLLLESKADVEAKNGNGYSPLFYARGDKVIQRLIKSAQKL